MRYWPTVRSRYPFLSFYGQTRCREQLARISSQIVIEAFIKTTPAPSPPPPSPKVLLGPSSCPAGIEIIFTMAWIIILKQSKTVANLNCWISPLLELRCLFLTARFLLWTFYKTKWYYLVFFATQASLCLHLPIKVVYYRGYISDDICYVFKKLKRVFAQLNSKHKGTVLLFTIGTFWVHLTASCRPLQRMPRIDND